MGSRVPGASAPGRDDHPLLRSLSAGDESAFWTLWQQYQRHLYAVCLRQMSGDEAEADDAVSRSMMVARDRLPEHAQRIENLEAWLTRLTCNVCLDIHRESRSSASWGSICRSRSWIRAVAVGWIRSETARLHRDVRDQLSRRLAESAQHSGGT